MKSSFLLIATIAMIAAPAMPPTTAAGSWVSLWVDGVQGDVNPNPGQGASVNVAPRSTPGIQQIPIGTPSVREVCAVVVCVGPVPAIPITTLGPISPIPLTPGLGVAVGWPGVQPQVGLTTIGPMVLPTPIVPVTICPTTCPFPYATVGGSLTIYAYVGGTQVSQAVPLP